MHKDSPFSGVSDQTWQAFWPEDKVIHSKYYKNQLSDLASTIDCGCFSLFWQKRAKIINFLPYDVNQLFCADATITVGANRGLIRGSFVLHMCFDKFLFWVKSRDLSQADNSIIRVSSFPSWGMGTRTFFFLSQQLNPEHSAKWMLSILSNLPLTRKTEKTEGKN